MLQISFKYKGGIPGGRGCPQRVYNDMRRQGMTAAGDYWYDHYRALHFTQEGAKKYGYTPRSGEGTSGKTFWRSYQGRKQKYLGHQRPLVKSGESEERTRVKRFTVRAAADRATLRMRFNAPTLSFKNPFSKIDMRKELTTITLDELEAMRRVFVNTVERLLRENQETQTVTYGGSGGNSMSPAGFVGSLSA